ncbi:DUF3152 domain-containing protein [Streptomyces sp. NPDC058001]|uniref:DUF3152 domain-containing protein n=1 Tax=Streptomyces sp. NPDC058001 TaxID=3346300 RepID=UPI0036EB869B
MGRHSRRGPANNGDKARNVGNATSSASSTQPDRPGQPNRPNQPDQSNQWTPSANPAPPPGTRGTPRAPGTPAQGVPRFADGTSARGVPRFPDGTPAHGVPRMMPDGTPARGVPRFPDGTPARGVPRFPDGTPAHGVPRVGPTGAQEPGVPHVRGGHPEQREDGGGWGAGGPREATGYGVASQGRPPGPRIPGPRREYVDAFEDADVFAPRTSPAPYGTGSMPRGAAPYASGPYTPPQRPRAPHAPASDPFASDPFASVTDWDTDLDTPAGDEVVRTVGPPRSPVDEPDTGIGDKGAKGGRGRALTGIAAAAVTTVLAVVVAGQVADDRSGGDTQARSADGAERATEDPASRSDDRPTPEKSAVAAAPLTYAQKMGKTYPLDPKLKASGAFSVVPGFVKAPGRGQVFRYRVDVEKGLGLDGSLFAEAVQKTLNDKRSWAHNGGRSFERVSSGKVDFVITLASPGTTAEWCAKSGLDTTQDNVSCDSASTDRVMINAYRWAQGSETYGDDIYPYRQMLINHEVGHRLGFNHVTCQKDGALAPVMQQQTKFLDHDGISCRANPWAFPGN